MEGMEVPLVNCTLNELDYEQLKASINPLDDMVLIYVSTLSLLFRLVWKMNNTMFACNK